MENYEKGLATKLLNTILENKENVLAMIAEDIDIDDALDCMAEDRDLQECLTEVKRWVARTEVKLYEEDSENEQLDALERARMFECWWCDEVSTEKEWNRETKRKYPSMHYIGEKVFDSLYICPKCKQQQQIQDIKEI